MRRNSFSVGDYADSVLTILEDCDLSKLLRPCRSCSPMQSWSAVASVTHRQTYRLTFVYLGILSQPFVDEMWRVLVSWCLVSAITDDAPANPRTTAHITAVGVVGAVVWGNYSMVPTLPYNWRSNISRWTTRDLFASLWSTTQTRTVISTLHQDDDQETPTHS